MSEIFDESLRSGVSRDEFDKLRGLYLIIFDKRGGVIRVGIKIINPESLKDRIPEVIIRNDRVRGSIDRRWCRWRDNFFKDRFDMYKRRRCGIRRWFCLRNRRGMFRR